MNVGVGRRVLVCGIALLAGAAGAQDHSQHEATPVDDHSAEHDHPAPQPGAGLLRTPVPELTDADRAAAVPAAQGHATRDDAVHGFLLFDQLETWDAGQNAGLLWEASGWVGTDLDRLWLRSQGERAHGSTQAADVELLFGRSVAVWWDVVIGLRHDFRPGAARSFAAIGIQGLAPQRFEVEATAYLGDEGHSAARLATEYELLITNRLVLQPLLQLDLYGKDDPQRGIGSGLSTAEAALRLRYEFTRRFAPYVGVVHEHGFGDTADLRRALGESVHDTRLVIGLRTWF